MDQVVAVSVTKALQQEVVRSVHDSGRDSAGTRTSHRKA